MSDDSKLSNDGALEALRRVARRWLDRDGARAYAIAMGANRIAALEELSIPAFLAHRALDILRAGKDPDVARWTEEAIAEVRRAEGEGKARVLEPVTVTGVGRVAREGGAQIVDPVSGAMVGATVIGAILAARVRTVAADEFYEQVPEELSEVLKAGASILPDTPDPSAPRDGGGGGDGGDGPF